MDPPLKVTSACYVSDVTDHTAPMVFAILKQIVTLPKQTVPELKYIHYLSDSPSSQFRNKHLMYIIAQHDKMFGIPCTWTYFESGHGKGPCDGIGGSSKRLADLAVKTDKASIRCAQDFADWGNKSSKKVQYSVVSQSDYIVAKNEINLFNAKPVPGTCLRTPFKHPKMELYVERHPVFAVNASQINHQNVIGSMYPYAVPHLRSQKHSQHLKYWKQMRFSHLDRKVYRS